MRDNVWYELEYTDFYCNYMLKKEFVRVQTVEEIEALLKLKWCHFWCHCNKIKKLKHSKRVL